MRRADRLFQIVQYLRGRRLTTAAQLAEWLEVAPRTIYRDMRDLLLSGIPIEGEAGVGYRLRPGFDLPPLMFSYDEVEALVAGARMVEAWGSPELAQFSRSALAKIAGALPPARRDELDDRGSSPSTSAPTRRWPQTLETIRRAIARRVVLDIDYSDARSAATQRLVRPLGLYFWGAVWTLGAWCEARTDFRNFRLDRMRRVALSDRRFVEEPGKGLNDFLKKMQAERSDG